MTEAPATVRPKKSGYLRSLDGWRAVAILGVIFTHDQPWSMLGRSTAEFKGYGGYGVDLFFAISGLLITTRILEEERIVGRFDIRRFYIRRLFRIQPVAWVYLAVVAAVTAAGVFPKEWFSWMGAFFLFLNFNYHPPGPPSLVGHFWSLAVEEHFYILLSLTLLVVKRHRIAVLAVMYVVSMLPFLLAYPLDHGWYDTALHPRSTQWELHGLLLAALAAVLLRRAEILRAVERFLYPWVAFTLTFAMMVAHNVLVQVRTHQPVRPLWHLYEQIDYAAMYFLVLWVVATVFHPKSLTTRFLELKWIRFVGTISYSLYLWHVLFFYGAGGSTEVHGWLMRMLSTSPARYIAAFTMAVLSYYFIEKPMIRIGHRMAPAASPGRLELADLPVERPDSATAQMVRACE